MTRAPLPLCACGCGQDAPYGEGSPAWPVTQHWARTCLPPRFWVCRGPWTPPPPVHAATPTDWLISALEAA